MEGLGLRGAPRVHPTWYAAAAIALLLLPWSLFCRWTWHSVTAYHHQLGAPLMNAACGLRPHLGNFINHSLLIDTLNLGTGSGHDPSSRRLPCCIWLLWNFQNTLGFGIAIPSLPFAFFRVAALDPQRKLGSGSASPSFALARNWSRLQSKLGSAYASPSSALVRT